MNALSDERILVLMPTARDCERTGRTLASVGLAHTICRDIAHLCQELERGAGAALLTEEAIEHDRDGCIIEALRAQPPWSNFPFVILAREAGSGQQIRESLNATLVDRPVKVRSLISVVRAALRSRRHQYAIRDQLAQREAAEEELRFALQAGRLGAWSVDLDCGTLECSEICKENFGRPAGSSFSYDELLDAIHPEDRERVQMAIGRAASGEADYDIEYRIVWPDKTVHWVLVRGRRARATDGTPLRLSGVSMDVTERKLNEEQLRDSAVRKDEFIALLAHELRNPLAPIRTGLQVLRLADANPQAAAGTREMMERQLKHMTRLIDDLLDVSRMSCNKMELRRGRVLLSDAVNNALETARPAIELEDHELEVSLPARPLFLDADLTRLAQVFSNLLTNAAKYTPRGGKLRLAAEKHGAKVVVSVSDNGIGIPAASLGNIFDMFSQVDRSMERDTGGLGIGLALVKGLVEMHGGTVAAASDGAGRGSTFTVTLPLTTSRESPVTSPRPNGVPALNRRVLVVDDSRDGADSLAKMLRLMGNDVRTANDGLEAVEAASEFRPEFVLMDVGMPRLNGLDATRRIREQEWGRHMTIIAITGWGQEGDRERTRAAGCNGHLVKPVDALELERMLGEDLIDH